MDFKKGMLGKFVWKKQANIKKGKSKKKKKKETKNLNVSKKGLMAKRQRDKMEFWKGRQKQKKKEEKKHLKTGLLWEQNRQKTSKIAGK